MVIVLNPELEAALRALALRQGVAAEVLALNVLQERLLAPAPRIEPQDEWERRLLEIARDCGTSLSDAALSREELYEQWPG